MTCPGVRTDRRHADRGDRRATPRPAGPCRHRWGRVGPGARVEVRVRGSEKAGDRDPTKRSWGIVAEPPAGPCIILECPECRQPIEFLTSAAERAA